MALITCPECGKEVSDQATACPHCGAPLKAKVVDPEKTAAKIRLLVGFLIVVLGCAYSMVMMTVLKGMDLEEALDVDSDGVLLAALLPLVAGMAAIPYVAWRKWLTRKCLVLSRIVVLLLIVLNGFFLAALNGSLVFSYAAFGCGLSVLAAILFAFDIKK